MRGIKTGFSMHSMRGQLVQGGAVHEVRPTLFLLNKGERNV